MGAIELPYSFTMMFGRNPYGQPVSKGDRGIKHGNPVCTFDLRSKGLRLVVSGLLPQAYRRGAQAQRGGIDVYFYHGQLKRQALRRIIENCNRVHPAAAVRFRSVSNPSPSIHAGGVDVRLVQPGEITKVFADTRSEFQSRASPPVDVAAKTKRMPLWIELEAPQAGSRIHLGGRFWTPYYRHTYIVHHGPSRPTQWYGITIFLPYPDEYSQFVQSMLLATA